ncbi:MAG: hypothetical protein ACXW4Z_19630 [Candidatus Binatia bacterium]
MFRRLTLAFIATMLLGVPGFADEKPGAQPKGLGSQLAKLGMRAKLEFAKSILDGLSVGDFEKIEEGAIAMRGLNEVEDFVRGRSPAYTAQLNVFRISTDGLVDSAKQRNINGAALAFTQMTISCVNCHRVLRESAK